MLSVGVFCQSGRTFRYGKMVLYCMTYIYAQFYISIMAKLQFIWKTLIFVKSLLHTWSELNRMHPVKNR